MAILKIRDANGNVQEISVIGVPAKEEWITIADTTVTEDVTSVKFSTDIDGNPFACKRIYAVIKLPTALSAYTGTMFGNDYDGQHMYISVPTGYAHLDINVEHIKDRCTVYSMGYTKPQNHFMDGGFRTKSRTDGNNAKEPMHNFFLSFYDGGVIASGSIVKVWGLKA